MAHSKINKKLTDMPYYQLGGYEVLLDLQFVPLLGSLSALLLSILLLDLNVEFITRLVKYVIWSEPSVRRISTSVSVGVGICVRLWLCRPIRDAQSRPQT